MKSLLLVAVAVVSVVCGTPLACAAPREQPNIVLFFVDDLGWQDTSVPFHSEVTPFNLRYRTPHMERLAAAGMKFTQAYATPICSPTRVSLMTGQNAARHRVTNWTLRQNASTDGAHPRLTPPAWNVNGLSPVAGIERTVHARALPEALRAAGYRTIHVGKAHFAAIGTPAADPCAIGFDVNVAGHAAGAPGSYDGRHGYASGPRTGQAGPSVWDVPGLEAYHGRDINLTDALTREAIRTIDDAVGAGVPFFLYLSHYAVHTPLMADERFIEHYGELPEREARYASMIEGMDASLGAVLGALERLGIADETIVLFLSDNGGLSAVARDGAPHEHNRPLSSGKGSLHEGGLRVPMIVRWPSMVEAATVCVRPVIVDDILPTLLDLLGMTSPADGIDGASFAAQLRRPEHAAPERPLIWHVPNVWGPTGPGIGPASALRRGDWKLIYYHDPEAAPRFELFDLARDLGERTNRLFTEPERARTLARELETVLDGRGAQWPTVTRTGVRVLLPTDALAQVLAGAGTR